MSLGKYIGIQDKEKPMAIYVPTEPIKKNGEVVFSPSDSPAICFENSHGEIYVLEHKESYITITGDEIDWEKRLIIDAVPITFSLSEDEISILFQAYKELITIKPLKQKFRELELYASWGNVTEIRSKQGELFCPICLRNESSVRNFHSHHVIPACCGGADEFWNLLNICKVCHTTLHLEPDPNEDLRGHAVLGLQKALHGISLWKSKISRRYDNDNDRDRILENLLPMSKMLLNGISEEDSLYLDSLAKCVGQIDYQLALLCLAGNELAKQEFKDKQEWSVNLMNSPVASFLTARLEKHYPLNIADIQKPLFQISTPITSKPKRIKKRLVEA
ncbi:MAG: HNH endonuclease [Novosphingobium sp.]|nr:HNH endonuclease [Novosphingobium sp.]